VSLADGGLAWQVRVMQFQATEHSTSVSGYVRNAASRALEPVTLLFEFLDEEGTVLYSAPLAVEGIEPGGRAQLSLRLDQGGAASWRYRRE
jgi:hypothetical protein